MLPNRHGAILFTGASASVKGYPQSAAFAMGKFALRGLAQSMARELSPQGIHVAHFVIDGGIRGAGRTEPARSSQTPCSIRMQFCCQLLERVVPATQRMDLGNAGCDLGSRNSNEKLDIRHAQCPLMSQSHIDRPNVRSINVTFSSLADIARVVIQFFIRISRPRVYFHFPGPGVRGWHSTCR